MNPRQTLLAARAFCLARWRARTLDSCAKIESFHRQRLSQLQRHLERHIDFYRDLEGLPFSDYPVIGKADLLAAFSRMNVAGISLDEVRNAVAEGRERIGGYIAGHSTGTSGNRGYYLISEAERFTWLGTILAKTLPDALWKKHRVALALPGLSTLYRSAGGGSRIELGFFDLAEGIDAWADRLTRFDPDTIVAPPKVLRRLAEEGRLTAKAIFSGAEVLDPIDRTIIEQASGSVVREIYMATEGLFAVSCPQGTLHLAEDVVHFEWEHAGNFGIPIVTDFTRRAQALVRYRMNDLLELAETTCTCGSVYRAVARIEGRSDDIFELPRADGQSAMVTPDVLRNVVVGTDCSITDFRIRQTGANDVRVILDKALPADLDALVAANVRAALLRLGTAPSIIVERGIEPVLDRKLRRVERIWKRD